RTYTEDLVLKADTLRCLGNVSFIHSDFTAAQKSLDEALQLFRQLNMKLGEANTLYYIGETYRFTDKPAEAAQKHEEALTLSREIGYKLGQANSLWALGTIHQ